MQSKRDNNLHFYIGNDPEQNAVAKKDEFDYSEIDALSLFNEKHPKVMEDRIKHKNWKFDYDLSTNKLSIKHRFKLFVKKYLGINIGYKNYKIV